MAIRAIEGLLENGQANQIAFVSVRGLLRARHDAEYARCLREAALVLPVSVGIVSGARFLDAGRLSLFSPYQFVIQVLSLIERIKGTVYLLGSRKETLEVAEENVRGSFHGVRVVGRFYGYFPKSIENNIVTAIKKSSPNLLLAGKGVPGKDRWVLRHKKDFNPGVSMWVGNCFEIFAGAERRTSRRLHAAGLGALSGIWRRPWRFIAIFPYLYYLFLLLVYRIFRL
jgi:N-acetylglucosaminyldiphosphoundecaprenol N-acetyl-beta-D-mannosaminyltransferase